MQPRNGEKIGWIGGWLGGFAWVAIMSVVQLAQGRTATSAVGLVIAAGALAGLFLMAPWRRPHTPYWRLMLPLYAGILVAVG
jgi:hypothetical protein